MWSMHLLAVTASKHSSSSALGPRNVSICLQSLLLNIQVLQHWGPETSMSFELLGLGSQWMKAASSCLPTFHFEHSYVNFNQVYHIFCPQYTTVAPHTHTKNTHTHIHTHKLNRQHANEWCCKPFDQRCVKQNLSIRNSNFLLDHF